jgi:hypothetical protein
MTNGRRRVALLRSVVVGLFFLCSSYLPSAHAQWGRQYYPPESNGPINSEFAFVRLRYACSSRSRCRSAWLTDWPDAEIHLLPGITRLTRVSTDEQGRIVDLKNDELMDYPWLYAVEVGQWYLDDLEATRLREYLDRGGFLMVDDFWGPYEWSIFTESMQRVFPDRPIVELEEGHPLLHVLYDLDQRTQIPGRGGQRGETPHWRGIFDDNNRLLVAINFNMDMGDAWEHADDPWYPEPMTALAYRFAVNYVIYSMTH